MHFTIKGHLGEFQFFPIMNRASINTLVHILLIWNDLGVGFWKSYPWTKECALFLLDKYCHRAYRWGSCFEPSKLNLSLSAKSGFWVSNFSQQKLLTHIFKCINVTCEDGLSFWVFPLLKCRSPDLHQEVVMSFMKLEKKMKKRKSRSWNIFNPYSLSLVSEKASPPFGKWNHLVSLFGSI